MKITLKNRVDNTKVSKLNKVSFTQKPDKKSHVFQDIEITGVENNYHNNKNIMSKLNTSITVMVIKADKLKTITDSSDPKIPMSNIYIDIDIAG